MLKRLSELAEERVDFAFETTLSSRSFAPWLRRQQAEGYKVQLLYCWLPTPAFAVARVEARVKAGGRDVPDDIIYRCFERSVNNVLRLYMPLADLWEVYDTSSKKPSLIARGERDIVLVIEQKPIWDYFTG